MQCLHELHKPQRLGGAVTKFRDHLEIELRKKTGNVSLTVFQDKRGIHGGDKWEQVLEEELDSAKLLLILLSPTWIRSEWCRKEYEKFIASDVRGMNDKCVVPLIWDKVSDIDAITPEQRTLLAQLRTYQVLIWDELQYDDWASPEPNRAAGKLAKELKLKLIRE